jgi:hypothetical protein
MRFRAARVRFLFDIDEQDSEYTRIVAELHQLRSASQLSGNRGAAPGLPSREAISEIVESLVSALYPRHFGPPGLDAREADAFVARTLAKALPALRHEIELALALEQEDARDAANSGDYPLDTGSALRYAIRHRSSFQCQSFHPASESAPQQPDSARAMFRLIRFATSSPNSRTMTLA